MQTVILAAAAALSVNTPGSGSFSTRAATYALGDLRYLRFHNGGGAFQFTAGAGALALSGADAEPLSRARYRFTITRVTLMRSYAVKASCDGWEAPTGGWRRVRCKGVLEGARPFRVRWEAK